MSDHELTEAFIDATAAHVRTNGLWPDRAAILAGALRRDYERWAELGDTLNRNLAIDSETLTSHERLCLELVRRIDQAESENSYRLLSAYIHAASLG